MSKIVGAISSYTPHMPDNLKDIIHLGTTSHLDNEVFNTLSYALNLLSKYIKNNKTTKFPVSLLFIDTNHVTIELFPQEMGIYVSLAVCPIGKWRNANYNSNQMLIFMLEEICHGLFQIVDEVQVKHVVLEIIKQDHPDIKLEQLYILD